MATLTALSISRDGVAVSGAAAAVGGDKFGNNGSQMLYVNNASVGSVNVTLATSQTVDGQAVADRVVAVAAGAAKMIGPFKPSQYNDVDGFVQVTYSAVTTVTVAVYKFTAESSQS